MFFDEEFDRMFQRMSRSFMDFDDVFEDVKSKDGRTYGPFYYGYSMTVGPDGKPQIQEYGNVSWFASNCRNQRAVHRYNN